MASGWRKLTIPLKPGQRTSLARGSSRRTATQASAEAACAAMRRCSVRSPRCTRKQSNGPGTAPTAFCTKRSRSSQPSSRVTTTPPTVSEWPPRYFVVECTAKSAPSASGCWLAGVAKVLSTATSGCAGAARATATTPSTSMTSSVGFVGVSTQTRRVSGRIAPGDARRGRSGRRGRRPAPSASGPCRRAGTCRRRGRRAARRARRPRPTTVSSPCSAAMPLANVTARPPSSSPSARSSAVRVGLAERA